MVGFSHKSLPKLFLPLNAPIFFICNYPYKQTWHSHQLTFEASEKGEKGEKGKAGAIGERVQSHGG